MDIATFFIQAVIAGIIGNRADHQAGNLVRACLDRLSGMRDASGAPLRTAVRKACLQAVEAACHVRLAALGLNPAAPRWAASYAFAPAEVRWLQQVRHLIQKDRAALARGRGRLLLDIEGEAWAPALTAGGDEEADNPVRLALAVRVLGELESRCGAAPTPFRALLLEGWSDGAGAEGSERQEWFGWVCVFFRRELRGDPGLREALQGEVLTPLRQEGVTLTMEQVELHLAAQGRALAARLDELEESLRAEVRQSSGEVRAHLDAHFERLLPHIGALPALSDQIRLLIEAVRAMQAEADAAGNDGLTDAEVLDSYLDWVADRHRELKIPGIPGVAASPVVELERVYVALQGDYASRAEQESVRLLLDQEWAEGALPLDVRALNKDVYAQRAQVLAERALPRANAGEIERRALTLGEAFRREPRLVILGGPGAGKTTLVRWLARRLAVALRAGEEEVWVRAYQVDPEAGPGDDMVSLGPARLPVLLRVSDFARELLAEKITLEAFLGRHGWSEERPTFRPDFAREELQGAPIPPERVGRLIRRFLREGRAVVILDGLDEIPDGNDRETVVAAIEAFIAARIDASSRGAGPRATHGDNQLVITSRVTGYDLAPVSSIPRRLLIQPMSERAVRTFCDAWARALHELEHPDDAPLEREARAATHAARLQDAIFDERRPGVRELASNPLLVTILAIVERETLAQLPEQRTRLYDLALRYMVKVWRDPGLSEREMLYVLAPLAHRVHLRTERTVARSEVYPLVEEHLARYRGQEVHPAFREEVDRFLMAMGREAGVISEQGKGLYGFLHQGFQEYLAARFLLRQEDVAGALTAVLGIPRWREPVLMALGCASWSEEWSPVARASLHSALLADDDQFGGVLPRAALLLCAALPEMAEPPSAETVSRVTRQLVRAYAARERMASFPALAAEIEAAVLRLLESAVGAVGAHARRTLIDLLWESASGSEPGDFLAAAALARKAGWHPHEVVECLLEGAPLDSAEWGWPVHALLAEVAERIPVYRLPLREALEKSRELEDCVRRDPTWQRVLAALCGGIHLSNESPEFDPRRMVRHTPLAPLLLAALQAGEPAMALVPRLRERSSGGGTTVEEAEGLVALAALGEDVAPALEAAGRDPARRGLAAAFLLHLSRAVALVQPALAKSEGALVPAFAAAHRRAAPLAYTDTWILPADFSAGLSFTEQVRALCGEFAAAAADSDREAATMPLARLFALLFSHHYHDPEDLRVAVAVLDVAGKPLDVDPMQVVDAWVQAWRACRSASNRPAAADTWEALAEGAEALPPALGFFREWLAELLVAHVDSAGDRHLMERIRPPSDDPLADPGPDVRRWSDALHAAQELFPETSTRDLIASLLRVLAPREKAALVVDYAAGTVSSRIDDSVYQVYVKLDTTGSHLRSNPHFLAGALARLHGSQAERLRNWELEPLRPSPRTKRALAAAALAAVDAIPGEMEVWRSWLICELAPLLRADEALRVEATAVALRIHAPELRSEALRALDVPPVTAFPELIDGAAASARTLPPAERGTILWRLARALPYGDALAYLGEAFEAALKAEDTEDRAFLLWCLLPELPWREEVWTALEDATRAVDGPDAKARALGRLATLKETGERIPMLHQSLAAAAGIYDGRSRAATLAELEPLLVTADLRREAAGLRAGLDAADRAFLDGAAFDQLLAGEALILSHAPSPDEVTAWTALTLAALAAQAGTRFGVPQAEPALWRALRDPTRRDAAAAALRERGADHALQFTVEAAFAVDALLYEGGEEAASTLLPAVWRPEPASVPLVRRWLAHTDARVRRQAVVLLAESGELRGIIPDVLEVLTGRDDRARCRTARALYRRAPFDRLHVSELGVDTIEALASANSSAPTYLRTTLTWMWEDSVVFDAAEPLEAWCARADAGDAAAAHVLRKIHHATPPAFAAVCRSLSESEGGARLALLEAIPLVFSSAVLSPKESAELREAVRPLIYHYDEAGRLARRAYGTLPLPDRADAELLLSRSDERRTDCQDTLTDFARLAARAVGVRPWAERELQARADDPALRSAAAGGLIRLWSSLPPALVLARLRAVLPQEWAPSVLLEAVLYACRDVKWGDYHDSVTHLGVAVVEGHPELLGELMDRMFACVFDEANVDRHTLLALVCEVAERDPVTFAARVPPRRAEMVLSRAARESPGWVQRRSAMKALGYLRSVSAGVVSALKHAMVDVELVQDFALPATRQFRTVEGAFLDELLRELEPDRLRVASPAATYALGEILVSLGRSERTTSDEQQRILRALGRAAQAPYAREEVHVMRPQRTKIVGTDGREHERLEYHTSRIEHLGRLDQCFYRMLAQIAGMSVSEAGGNPPAAPAR